LRWDENWRMDLGRETCELASSEWVQTTCEFECIRSRKMNSAFRLGILRTPDVRKEKKVRLSVTPAQRYNFKCCVQFSENGDQHSLSIGYPFISGWLTVLDFILTSSGRRGSCRISTRHCKQATLKPATLELSPK
jgi:hypothetical protein